MTRICGTPVRGNRKFANVHSRALQFAYARIRVRVHSRRNSDWMWTIGRAAAIENYQKKR